MTEVSRKCNDLLFKITMEGQEVMDNRDDVLIKDIIELVKDDINVEALLKNVLRYCCDTFYGYPNCGIEEMFKGTVDKEKFNKMLEIIGGLN